MSNKTQLQTNNTTLDGYIARINAAKEVAASLPEAGGSSGGSVETITITCTTLPDPGTVIYYMDETMTLQQKSVGKNAQYTIVKGTIFIVENWPSTNFCGYQSICGMTMCRGFLAIN